MKFLSDWGKGVAKGADAPLKDERGMSAFLLFLKERRVEHAPFFGKERGKEQLMLCV